MGVETLTCTIVTLRTNGAGAAKIPQQFCDARLHTQLATIAAYGEAGSTIKIARLPPGAMVHWFDVQYEAMTTAVTAMIGDAADDNRWVLTGGVTSMLAAGYQHVLPRAGDYTITAAGVYTPGTVGVGYVTTAWTDVILTTEAQTITGTPKLEVVTAYSLVA